MFYTVSNKIKRILKRITACNMSWMGFKNISKPFNRVPRYFPASYSYYREIAAELLGRFIFFCFIGTISTEKIHRRKNDSEDLMRQFWVVKDRIRVRINGWLTWHVICSRNHLSGDAKSKNGLKGGGGWECGAVFYLQHLSCEEWGWSLQHFRPPKAATMLINKWP